MIVRTIAVRMSRKLSKNYNSTEVSVELVADIEPGEDYGAAKRHLGAQCAAAVREEFHALNQKALTAGGAS